MLFRIADTAAATHAADAAFLAKVYPAADEDGHIGNAGSRGSTSRSERGLSFRDLAMLTLGKLSDRKNKAFGAARVAIEERLHRCAPEWSFWLFDEDADGDLRGRSREQNCATPNK